MAAAAKKADASTDTADTAAITIPAINADEDFALFVMAEMDDAGAEIGRLNGLKIARERHFATAIDRIVAARDAEFAALDEQIDRQNRKHTGCSAALQSMGVEPASTSNVVSMKRLESEVASHVA